MDLSMDLRAIPEGANGVAVTPPLLNDSVLPYMVPSNFLTWMRWKLETPAWIIQAYEELIMDRARRDLPENLPNYEKMIQRFRNHSDWVSMRPALENKPILRQAVVPHSTPGDDPAFYEYDKKTFLLPRVDQKQFNLWGLDPQQFFDDMLAINPGRIKEISTAQIVYAAGRFAKLRFPGADLGPDQHFIYQFGTSNGLAALLKLDRERRTILAEDRPRSNPSMVGSAALTKELQRYRSGMYGEPRKSEKEIYRGIRKREEEIRQGIPRQDPCQPGVVFTGGDDKILRAHPLRGSYRARLASSGMAVIVSLPHLEEQAASVVATHFHLHPTEPEHRHIWVKIELVAAFCPAVVLELESPRVKERVLAQLQHSSRFDFLEERGVRLEAYTLREDIAREPTFILGSGPLKSLAMLDESLRAFFWYKGYVSNRDLVTEQLNRQEKRTVMIQNNRGYPWVQKCTVTKGGNGDQEIRAEPVEECSICLHSGPRRPLNPENVKNNDWENLRQVPDFPDALRTAPASRALVPVQNTETQSPPSTTSNFPPIAPAYTTADRSNNLKRVPTTHPQTSSTNAYQTPARARDAPMSVKAPSRKVMSLKHQNKAHANCSDHSVPTRRDSTNDGQDCRDHESPMFGVRVRFFF